jgi:hypothetical protein
MIRADDILDGGYSLPPDGKGEGEAGLAYWTAARVTFVA